MAFSILAHYDKVGKDSRGNNIQYQCNYCKSYKCAGATRAKKGLGDDTVAWEAAPTDSEDSQLSDEPMADAANDDAMS